MRFNLFDKAFEELTIQDIFGLKDRVQEGYHVEYKSDCPVNLKIAGGIASLANTYGGWYFLGIATDENHVAKSFPGIDPQKHPDPKGKIRNIIKDTISPNPLFYIKTFQLENKNLIVAVYIPDGQDVPFVTNDGKIYIRISDSSNPIKEADRYTLDKLYDSNKEKNLKFLKFSSDGKFHDENDKSTGWLKIYLNPYPEVDLNKFGSPTPKDITDLINLSKKELRVDFTSETFISGNVPLNSGQVSTSSIIVRQTEPNMANYHSITIEFFNDGKAKFFIPIETYSGLTFDGIDSFQNQEVKNVLKQSFRTNPTNFQKYTFFNYGRLVSAILILVRYYIEWIGENNLISGFRTAIKAENIRHFVPFFDTKEWAEHAKTFGVPILIKNNVSFPVIEDSTILRTSFDSAENPISFPLAISGITAQMLGLPLENFFFAIQSASKNKLT